MSDEELRAALRTLLQRADLAVTTIRECRIQLAREVNLPENALDHRAQQVRSLMEEVVKEILRPTLKYL